jgi:hypothetical protein
LKSEWFSSVLSIYKFLNFIIIVEIELYCKCFIDRFL